MPIISCNGRGSEIRYALMSAHYRTALNFTEDSLVQARASIKRIQEAHRVFCSLRPSKLATVSHPQAVKAFKAALFDDLNVAGGLAAVFEVISEAMRKKEAGLLTPEEAHQLITFIELDWWTECETYLNHEKNITWIGFCTDLWCFNTGNST